jgi:CPA2 family monovalent cation:H+ antiporter-2
MPGFDLLRDLAVVMIVAAAVTIVLHRLRQPVVLGYLVAGVIIGPHTPPFPLVRDAGNIETLSNLGIVFLMFSLGLDFNFRKLRQFGPAAGTAAFLSALLMIWLGYGFGRTLGWGRMDSLFLGGIVSISSSTIVVKTFQSLGKLSEHYAQTALTFMLVEDIIAVAIIATLSSIAITGSLAVSDVLSTLGRIGIFIVVIVLLGVLLVPRVVRYVARFRDDEVLVVTSLGLCFGLALLAVKLGYSAALGAFIMGAIVAESREHKRIEPLITPLRDMFVAVFFVSVGMMLDPRLMWKYKWPALGVALLAIVGRSAIAAFATYTTGVEGRNAFRVGLGLTPLGEFSFLIAQLGAATHVTSRFLFPVAVSASALTALAAPYLVRESDRMTKSFQVHAPKPLSTFLALYSKWVGHLRATAGANNLWRFVRKPLFLILINISVVTAMFVAASFLVVLLWKLFPIRILFDSELDVLVWFAVAFLSLPPFLALWRNLEAIGFILAESAVPTASRQGMVHFDRQRLLKNIFLLIGAVLLGLWIIALSSRFLPPWPLLLVLVLLSVLIARRQWRSIVHLHSRMEIAVREVFSELPSAKPAQEAELLNLIKEKYPWDFQLEELTLPNDSAAVGRTIRDLALRKQTGASIVGIERAGFHVVNPAPGTPLFPGDGLLLMGEKTQIQRASEILLKTDSRPPGAERFSAAIEVETIPLEKGSPLIGKTIGECRLRQQTGATIIGIQRGDQRNLNPGPDTRIETDDVMLLLGNRQQLDAARRLCALPV